MMSTPKYDISSLLLINLGGTISCGQSEAGLVPRLKAGELLERIRLPARIKVTPIDLMERTILFPKDWLSLASHIFSQRHAYDGFVVALGTDTLAHVSAALSLIIRNLGKPVVFTGAMSPITAPRSDGRRNLRDALRLASTKVNGIFAVFNGQIMDGACVSKVRSSAVHAFESINTPALGSFFRGRLTWRRKPRRALHDPVLEQRLDPRVCLWKLTPQTTSVMLKPGRYCRGLVVEGFGDGNVPNHLIPALQAVAQKKFLVLTTQCPYGGVYHRYQGGAALIKSGALSCGRMTTELSMAKLMLALAKGKNRESVIQWFTSDNW